LKIGQYLVKYMQKYSGTFFPEMAYIIIVTVFASIDVIVAVFCFIVALQEFHIS